MRLSTMKARRHEPYAKTGTPTTDSTALPDAAAQPAEEETLLFSGITPPHEEGCYCCGAYGPATGPASPHYASSHDGGNTYGAHAPPMYAPPPGYWGGHPRRGTSYGTGIGGSAVAGRGPFGASIAPHLTPVACVYVPPPPRHPVPSVPGLPVGTLHTALQGVVTFHPYPTDFAALPPDAKRCRPPAYALSAGAAMFDPSVAEAAKADAAEGGVRCFFGQLPYAITELQLAWLCYTFGGKHTVTCAERIMKRTPVGGGSVTKHLPTGCVHGFCTEAAMAALTYGLHKRVLIDDTGVWHAANEAEKAALEAYCLDLKHRRVTRVAQRPYDAVSVERATSKYRGVDSSALLVNCHVAPPPLVADHEHTAAGSAGASPSPATCDEFPATPAHRPAPAHERTSPTKDADRADGAGTPLPSSPPTVADGLSPPVTPPPQCMEDDAAKAGLRPGAAPWAPAWS